MKREMPRSISTSKAPAAIGPYSQAKVAGSLVFVSGQLPLDPESGELIEGDIEAKTQRVIQNIQAILDAAGTDLAHVVKTTVFLTNMADFATVNRAYGHYLGASLPARSAVQVSGLPRNADIEMEAIAILS